MINVRNYLWLKIVNVWQSKSNLIECNYERGTEYDNRRNSAKLSSEIVKDYI